MAIIRSPDRKSNGSKTAVKAKISPMRHQKPTKSVTTCLNSSGSELDGDTANEMGDCVNNQSPTISTVSDSSDHNNNQEADKTESGKKRGRPRTTSLLPKASKSKKTPKKAEPSMKSPQKSSQPDPVTPSPSKSKKIRSKKKAQLLQQVANAPEQVQREWKRKQKVDLVPVVRVRCVERNLAHVYSFVAIFSRLVPYIYTMRDLDYLLDVQKEFVIEQKQSSNENINSKLNAAFRLVKFLCAPFKQSNIYENRKFDVANMAEFINSLGPHDDSIVDELPIVESFFDFSKFQRIHFISVLSNLQNEYNEYFQDLIKKYCVKEYLRLEHYGPTIDQNIYWMIIDFRSNFRLFKQKFSHPHSLPLTEHKMSHIASDLAEFQTVIDQMRYESKIAKVSINQATNSQEDKKVCTICRKTSSEQEIQLCPTCKFYTHPECFKNLTNFEDNFEEEDEPLNCLICFHNTTVNDLVDLKEWFVSRADEIKNEDSIFDLKFQKFAYELTKTKEAQIRNKENYENELRQFKEDEESMDQATRKVRKEILDQLYNSYIADVGRRHQNHAHVLSELDYTEKEVEYINTCYQAANDEVEVEIGTDSEDESDDEGVSKSAKRARISKNSDDERDQCSDDSYDDEVSHDSVSKATTENGDENVPPKFTFDDDVDSYFDGSQKKITPKTKSEEKAVKSKKKRGRPKGTADKIKKDPSSSTTNKENKHKSLPQKPSAGSALKSNRATSSKRSSDAFSRPQSRKPVTTLKYNPLAAYESNNEPECNPEEDENDIYPIGNEFYRVRDSMLMFNELENHFIPNIRLNQTKLSYNDTENTKNNENSNLKRKPALEPSRQPNTRARKYGKFVKNENEKDVTIFNNNNPKSVAVIHSDNDENYDEQADHSKAVNQDPSTNINTTLTHLNTNTEPPNETDCDSTSDIDLDPEDFEQIVDSLFSTGADDLLYHQSAASKGLKVSLKKKKSPVEDDMECYFNKLLQTLI